MYYFVPGMGRLSKSQVAKCGKRAGWVVKGKGIYDYDGILIGWKEGKKDEVPQALEFARRRFR